MSTTILLGDEDDPHVSIVARHLYAQRQDYATLGIGGNFGRVSVELNAGQARLRLSDRSFRPEDIKSVWDRARSSMPILEDESWQYIFRERKAMLEGLAAFAPMARWMNPPHASALASNKIAQLIAASSIGLSIPRTLITNDPATVRDLAAETDWSLIFKALSWLATTKGEVLFTTELTPVMVDHLEERLRPAPCIFQKKIEKQFELRVTVVADHVFPARIESQARDTSRLDWRRDQEQLSYRPDSIPAWLETSLLALCRTLNLNFGAVDLCMTPQGEWVFFEVNPAGNWLWIEESTGLPISTHIAQWLAS